MKAPDFWNKRDAWPTRLLRPLGRIYGDIVRARLQMATPYISKLPVICVGNVTMGGSGKTPVVQAVVRLLKENGKQPAVLLRGYGGTYKGTMTVDPSAHDAVRVGDEALLHADLTQTVVSADRVKGAQAIEHDTWNTHIVMDDGLQNPSLKKTISLLVIDGANPFGNGEVFPAGPLREPVDDAMRRVDAIIVVGQQNADIQARYGFVAPVFQAKLVSIEMPELAGKPVIAFAGIGNPQKFFTSVAEQGAVLVGEHVFPDHYAYTPHDLKHLHDKAARTGAVLITTRKDWVRLSPAERMGIHVLDVSLEWQDPVAVMDFFRQKGLL